MLKDTRTGKTMGEFNVIVSSEVAKELKERAFVGSNMVANVEYLDLEHQLDI